MTLFSLPKLDAYGVAAIALTALAVPVYSVTTYEGTLDTSSARWLALFLVVIEAIVVMLALFRGWNPVASWKMLPAHLRFAMALWTFVASIATILSSDIGFSATFQLFWIIHGLFAFALGSMLTSRWNAMSLPLLVYFSLGLLVHSVAVYSVVWMRGPGLDEWERYSVGNTNPRQYIFYADALLGIGIGFLIGARDRALWLWAILLIFSGYHLFAWSGGRASFGISLVIPLVAAGLARSRWKRVMLVSYGSALVAFPLSLLTAPSHAKFGFKSVISRIADAAGPNEYSSGRLEIWSTMLADGLKKPVFGHGQIGTLDVIGEVFDNFPMHAHNALVHIFQAWGGLGMGAFAIGLLPLLATIRARLEAQPLVAWPPS